MGPAGHVPLLVATGVGLGLGLGLLTYAPAPLSAVGAVALVLLASGVYVRTLGAGAGLVALLVATVLLDRYTYRLGGVAIRGEQVAALVGFGVLGGQVAARGRVAMLRPNLVEVLLVAWFSVGLFSSVLEAPDRGHSVKELLLLVVCSLGTVLPRRLLDPARPEQVDVVVRLLLVALAVEAAYGTAAYLAHVFGSSVSLTVNEASGHLNAYGTLWEPNVFGAFCAAGAAGWTYLGPRLFRSGTWLGIGACLAGTLASYTRAAWGAAAIGVVLAVILIARRKSGLRHVALGIGAAAVLGLLVLGADRIGDYYPPIPQKEGAPVRHPVAGRGLFALLANSVDVIGRVYQFQTVFGDLKGPRILLGSGMASYGERHVVEGQAEHIANLELTVLNDTGLLGVLVFAAFLLALAYRVWQARGSPLVVGLAVVALVILMTNTATETLELMISWLMIGLLLAAIDAARGRAFSTTANARTAPGSGS